MSTINIADVLVNGGTQSRAAIDRSVVSDYADAIRDGATFPPITVYFDGSSYWLADGFHRYEAYAAAQVYDVPADIRQGTQRDAILFSVGANASHGLRRTNDDKRRAVLTLLNDPEWAAWSDREIARRCGVSHQTVSNIRPSVKNGQMEAGRTVTRNGTTYQQNTANIGASSNAGQKANEAEATCSGPVESPDPAEPPFASNPDQEPPAPPVDPAEAKMRRELKAMTTDGLIDEVIGLRRAVDEHKASERTLKEDLKRAEAVIKEMSSADDKNRSIAMLERQLKASTGRINEHLATIKKMEFRLKKAEARVKELEAMPVSMDDAA